jgi:putative copper resistance protein D
LDDVLIGIRTLHIASTLMVGGILSFCCLVADPADAAKLARAESFRRPLTRLLWLCLVLALFSGIAWLVVLSADIAGETPAQALSEDVPWVVLTETRFGHAWIARFAIAGLIAAEIALYDPKTLWTSRWLRVGAMLLAAGFLGLLASSGHAGAAGGFFGDLHWIADALHLVAAGAWLGGLVPLALLLALAGRAADGVSMQIAIRATPRFSALGIACVATILATGIINTFVLVGSWPALVETDYGRLLLIKIAVFFAMVAIAAVNLFCLRHRMHEARTLRQLKWNALAEAGLGLAVIAIVGALGIMTPGLPMHHVH